MKLLLEYQQNPRHRSANHTLQQAEEAARLVYTSERVSLSYARVRTGGGIGREPTAKTQPVLLGSVRTTGRVSACFLSSLFAEHLRVE